MDEQSFEILYGRYSKVVYCAALRILRDIGIAEDVTHEVFLQLWRNASRFDSSRGSMATWLLTITRNKALDRFRLKGERQRRKEDQDLDAITVFDTSSCSYEHVLDELRCLERVRGFISGMSSGQRTAIELAFFEEMSHEQIAAMLGAPLGTVKSWIRTGLLSLRLHLATPQPVSAKLSVAPAFASAIAVWTPV